MLKPYRYTNDWTSYKIDHLTTHLSDYAQKENIHYLEIGVHEGRTLIWLLENIFKHPTTKATVVDIFEEATYFENFKHNIKLSGHSDKITTHTGPSQLILKNLAIDSFDVIYIDGSHTSQDVMQDLVLSHTLLKTHGHLLIDDYLMKENEPFEFHPKMAVDAFLTIFHENYEMLHLGYDLVLKKIEKDCASCLRVNKNLSYDFLNKQLIESTGKSSITLGNHEIYEFNQIFSARGFKSWWWDDDKKFFSNSNIGKYYFRHLNPND